MQERSSKESWFKTFFFFATTIALAYAFIFFRGSVRLIPATKAEPATVLALRTVDGEPFDLQAYAGQVVVLNAWTSWCGYCRREIPQLRRLDERYGDDELVVVGVNLESTEELSDGDLVDLSEAWGIGYPVVRPLGELTGSFAFSGGIPHTWIVDRQGRVRVSHSGQPSPGSLQRICQRLLAESPASATATGATSRAITSSQR